MKYILKNSIYLVLVLLLLSTSAFAKKYTVCKDLRSSVSYITPEAALMRKGKRIALNGAMWVIKEGSKIVLTAGLGLTGLPISLGASALLKALNLAGIEIGENRRQMISVLTTSEALVNKEIDLNTNFGKADLVIFEDFLNSKRELNRLFKRKLKKDHGIEEFVPLNNIEFSRLIVDLEQSEGEDFYCKQKRNGKVKFRGFGRYAKNVLFRNYLVKSNIP